jgi:N-acetylneuraminate lyase
VDKIKIKGIVPALITPLKTDGHVNEAVLRRHIEWLVSFGIHGLYVAGYTGEGLLLEPVERMKLLESVVDIVKGRIQVVVHIADMRMKHTLDLVKHAQQIGADVVSSIPPIYFKYSADEIEDYYRTLADSTDLPLLLYSNNAGNALNFNLVKNLINHKQIIGLKWTHQDYYQMERLKGLNGGNINIVNGPDESLICGLAAGADAGIGSTYNIMPGLFTGLYRAFEGNDIQKARELQKTINNVIEVLLRYDVIKGIRTVLKSIGTEVGDSPVPLGCFSDVEQQSFLAALDWFDFKNQKIQY